MKIKENKLEYISKGELVTYENDIVFIQVIKRDEIIDDNINLDEFLKDLKDFCDSHEGKEIKIKLSAIAETE